MMQIGRGTPQYCMHAQGAIYSTRLAIHLSTGLHKLIDHVKFGQWHSSETLHDNNNTDFKAPSRP